MENWKEIFASFGLWSLVEDISDDGDGEGDNLQLTKDGELFVSEITQELDRAREEGYKEGRRYQMELNEMLNGVSVQENTLEKGKEYVVISKETYNKLTTK